MGFPPSHAGLDSSKINLVRKQFHPPVAKRQKQYEQFPDTPLNHREIRLISAASADSTAATAGFIFNAPLEDGHAANGWRRIRGRLGWLAEVEDFSKYRHPWPPV